MKLFEESVLDEVNNAVCAKLKLSSPNATTILFIILFIISKVTH